MRLTLPAAGLALALATVSSVGQGAKPATAIDPRSALLLRQGEAEAAAGRFATANDLIESALAVDPDNRAAFVALAGIASKQGLNGKAIRLYREALSLDANDQVALAGQGQALVAKGALAKARDNLAQLQRLCSGQCPQSAQLAAAIARGGATAELSVQAVTPRPSVAPVKPQ